MNTEVSMSLCHRLFGPSDIGLVWYKEINKTDLTRPARPHEQDRLSDFFSILPGQRRERVQRYTALMSIDPNMTKNPNLKNCQTEMVPEIQTGQ